MRPFRDLHRHFRRRGAPLLPAVLLVGSLVAAGPDVAPPDVTPVGAPLAATAAAGDTLAARIVPEQLLEDLAILSRDSMQGRRAGTIGAERARRFIRPTLEARGLAPLDGQWTHEFALRRTADAEGLDRSRGVSLFGMVEGTHHPERFIVVSAHYDHLGVRNGAIYNGADDNASGTAALLALGEYLSRSPPRHSFLFVAFDAEETGLEGARAFVADPPIPLEWIMMNVNLDMVSRSERGELYAAGTHQHPFLVPLVEEVARDAQVTLLRGHDTPDLPAGDDWSSASDHGAFHEAGIPFLYFGVEDHPGYHRPSDTFENITPEFYVNAVETVLDFLLVMDREGEEILP